MTATKQDAPRQVGREIAEGTKLLTTPEAASRLGVSKRTLQELAAERKIAQIKFGRNVRFDPADLEAFINSHRSLPTGWKKPQAKAAGRSVEGAP
jgi:excisionase family DNA binding protein